MASFWRITQRDYYWTALELKKHIPELKHSDVDDIAHYLRDSGIGILQTEKIHKPVWIRLTLPLGLLLLIVLLVTSPVKFMVTGKWGYKIEWISNWFKALGF